VARPAVHAGESVGVLGLMWALAGRIVERRNDTR
jgi:hypothetical protein